MRKKVSTEPNVIANVDSFVEIITPFLDLVLSGPFKEYTLHNKLHSLKILNIAFHIMAKETIENLSPLELQLIIYASFFHDLGMSLTSKELERIISSQEYFDSLNTWPELSKNIESCRAALKNAIDTEKPKLELRIAQLHNAGIAHYLRPLHTSPDRYRYLIDMLVKASGKSDLFFYKGVSFADYLVDICSSHNLPVANLLEPQNPYELKYADDALIAGEHVNVRFIACILRLCDIMDFDRERTPRILFDSLGIENRSIPGAELSLQEWNKHLSVHTIEIREDELIYSGVSKHPVIEKSIRDFCVDIEREIRDTTALLKKFPKGIAEQYQVELPLCVRPRIHAEGYSYKDFSLSLNQAAIVSLLMGERLYSHSETALRELIQNSIDACMARQCLSLNNYTPEISIDSYMDKRDRRWIRIRDNGIGMDEYVLGEYFLKLGNTYYDSPEFKRALSANSKSKNNFVPISRFGIGIASVFMVADVLEIDTCRFQSPRGDNLQRILCIERFGSLAYIVEKPTCEAGTELRLRLKPDYNSDLFLMDSISYLREVVVRPAVPIKISFLWSEVELGISKSINLSTKSKDILAELNMGLV